MEGREQLRRGLKYGIRGLSQKGIGDPPSCFASRSARRPCPRQPPRKRSSPIHTNTLNSEAYQSPNPYRAIRGKAAFGNTIDVHTHLYLPGYMDLLRRRAEVPRIIPAPPGSASDAPERLLILPGEDADGRTLSGRPIGREYWSVEEKLSFMDVHGRSMRQTLSFFKIDVSDVTSYEVCAKSYIVLCKFCKRRIFHLYSVVYSRDVERLLF